MQSCTVQHSKSRVQLHRVCLSSRVQGPTRSFGVSACQSMCQRQQQRHNAIGSPLDLPLLPACSAPRASSSSGGGGNGAAMLTAAQAARPEVAAWLRRELEALMLESDVGMVRVQQGFRIQDSLLPY